MTEAFSARRILEQQLRLLCHRLFLSEVRLSRHRQHVVGRPCHDVFALFFENRGRPDADDMRIDAALLDQAPAAGTVADRLAPDSVGLISVHGEHHVQNVVGGAAVVADADDLSDHVLHVADRLLWRAVDHDRRAVRDGGERDDRRALSDRFCHRQRVAASVQRTSGDDLLNRDGRAFAGQDRHVEAFFGEVTAGLGVQRRRITDQIVQRRDEIDCTQLLRLQRRRKRVGTGQRASCCKQMSARDRGHDGRSFLNLRSRYHATCVAQTRGQSMTP